MTAAIDAQTQVAISHVALAAVVVALLTCLTYIAAKWGPAEIHRLRSGQPTADDDQYAAEDAFWSEVNPVTKVPIVKRPTPPPP